MPAQPPTWRSARRAVDHLTATPARWLTAVLDDHDELWAFDDGPAVDELAGARPEPG